MWLITDKGFFSIVEKTTHRERDTLTVRARVRGDLAAFIGINDLNVDVQESLASDYRFRAEIGRAEVAEIVASQVRSISYPNFKTRVRQAQGFERAHLYSDVWATLYGLQQGDSWSP